MQTRRRAGVWPQNLTLYRLTPPHTPPHPLTSLSTYLKHLPVIAKRLDAPLAAVRSRLAGALGSSSPPPPPLDRALTVRELQSAYVYGAVMVKKARDLVRPYVAPHAVDDAARVTWALFVSSKHALLPPFPDLVTGFALLVACAAWVIGALPDPDLAAPSALPRAAAADADAADRAPFDVSSALIATHRVPPADAARLADALTACARQVLGGVLAFDAAAPHPRGWRVPEPRAPGGVKAAALPPIITALDATFATAPGVCIDERAFLEEPPPPLPATRPAVGDASPPPAAPSGTPRAPPPISAASRLATPPSLSRCSVRSPAASTPHAPFLSPAAGTPRAAPLRAAPSPLRTPASPLRLLPGAGNVTPGGCGGAFGNAYALGTPGRLLAPPLPRGGVSGLPPPTPVSDALASLAWLRDAAAGGEETPETLVAALTAAGADAAAVVARARAGAAAVFDDATPPTAAPAAAAAAAVQADRRREAVGLYLRTLDTVLASETARLTSSGGNGTAATQPTTPPPRAVSALARAQRFHAVLFALACEAVVAAYRCATLPFPAVLDALALPAFDAVKGVDAFLRANVAAPRGVKRHIYALEERCLESVAWAAGSPLYTLLAAAEGSGEDNNDAVAGASPALSPASTPSKRKATASDADTPDGTPSKRAAAVSDADGTPVKQPASDDATTTQTATPAAKPALDAASSPASPATASLAGLLATPAAPAATATAAAAAAPPPPPPAAAAAIVASFLTRVERLVTLRAVDLLDWLDWGGGAASPAADRSAAAARVTSLLRWCVHEGTPLFHGRHVDQIMLCAVYGVCKVSRAAPTFRDVVAAYRRAPHARPDVFRAVPLDPLPTVGASTPHPTPRRTGDIIQFYNTVFVPAAREQLLALGAGAAPPAPPAPRAPPPPAWRPAVATAQPLVVVSPMAPAPAAVAPAAPPLVFGVTPLRGGSSVADVNAALGAAAAADAPAPGEEAAAASALRGLVAAAATSSGA